MLILIPIFFGCAKEKGAQWIDRAGNSFEKPPKIERVITAAPSNTEIIIDLDMADKIIAADRWSRDVQGLPENIPLLDSFNPDEETIISLNPDLIIAFGSAKTGGGDDPYRLLEETGITVIYIPMGKSIADIYDDILFVSDLLSVRERGEALVVKMKNEISSISNNITNSINNAEKGAQIYFEISPFPDVVSFGKDTFLDNMITVLGCENIFADSRGVIFPSAETIVERDPDIIFTNIAPEAASVAEIMARDGYGGVKAIRNNRVYYIDADSSSRPSARIVKALKQMAQAINGD
jgi:iron complex transport system substrate-binding protein